MTEISEAKETQVTKQMDSLKDRLSGLEKNVSNMKIRLGSVLRDDSLGGSDEKNTEDQEPLVQLANDIRASADRVNAMNIEIDTLLRELEL